MTTARLLAGASGYSFKEWKGTFYPDKIKPEDMLAWYCGAPADGRDQQHVLPDAQDLGARELGRDRRPTDFRFAIKASRRITHMARLKAESAAEPLGYLYRNLAALGAKRGPVLFQLPPNLKKDLPRLTAFLALLPAGSPRGVRISQRHLVRRRRLRRAQGRRRRARASPSARTTRRRRWSRPRRGATSGCASRPTPTPICSSGRARSKRHRGARSSSTSCTSRRRPATRRR